MANALDHQTEQSKTVSEGLADLQSRVTRLLQRTTDDDSASEIADVLHDISALRLMVDLPQEGDRRQDLREPRRDISIFRMDGQDVDCAIQDLSIGGAYIVADLPLQAGMDLELKIPEAGTVTAKVVGTTSDGVHVQFPRLNDAQLIAITNSLRAHYSV